MSRFGRDNSGRLDLSPSLSLFATMNDNDGVGCGNNSGGDIGAKMEFRLTESVVTKDEASYLATLMNTSQVGIKLGLSVKQVKRLVDKGKMNGVKISGRLYIHRADFEAYCQQKKEDLEARVKLIGAGV